MSKVQFSRGSGVPVPLSVLRDSYVPRKRSSSIEGRSRASSSKPMIRRSASENRRPSSIASNQILRGMSPACGNGRSRLSSGFALNRGSAIDNKRISKDPRPLTDKAYQSKCINNLVDFLIENGFPYPLSVKKLMSPSKKDFELMFQFLCCMHIEPKFQVIKLEEDAPKILKHLCYPFLIAKSTYLAVNRMTWPTLLGILTWLIGLNKFIMNLEAEEFFPKSDFDKRDEKFMVIKYSLESYAANNEGNEEEDYEMFTKLVTKRDSPDFSEEKLEKILMDRKKELVKVESELAFYEELQSNNDKVVTDIGIIQEFTEKIKERFTQKTKIVEDMAKKIARNETEIKDLEAKVAEKEAAYREQGFDGQHAQNFFSMQKQDLITQLEMKTERVKSEEKKFWDLEIQNAQLLNKISVGCQKFNETYATLRRTIKDAVAPLKSIDMPAAVKLVNEFKIDLPECEMKPNSSLTAIDESKQLISTLELSRDYIGEQKDCVMNIRAAQRHYMGELESRMSELKINEDLIRAHTLQKKRCIENREKEFRETIEKLERKLAEIKLQCERINTDVLETEELIVVQQQQIAESNTLTQKRKADHKALLQMMDEEYSKRKRRVSMQIAEYDAFSLKLRKMMEDTIAKIENTP